MTTTPSPVTPADQRLAVAPAGITGRMQGLLQAYLSGPGRRLFVVRDATQAQALIVDHDNPASRAELLRLRAAQSMPVIVLALRDPGLSGSVWVPKPVAFEGLAQAAQAVRAMLATGPAAHDNGAAAGPTEPFADALSGPGEAAPALVAQPSARSSAMPAMSQPRPVAASKPLPRRAFGGETSPGLGKGLWMGAGVLGIVALASSLGWSPPTDSFRQPGASGAESSKPVVAVQLDAVVQQSLRDYRLRGEEENRYIDAQRAELRRAESPSELRMRLDQLAAMPKALAAHNEAVYNKVDVSQPSATGGADRALRATLESLVSVALTGPSEPDKAYVAGLLPEAQARVAEMRTVVVREGDSLSSIARRAYGDPDAYETIFRANPLVLASADHIYPGQVLRVPARALVKGGNQE